MKRTVGVGLQDGGFPGGSEGLLESGLHGGGLCLSCGERNCRQSRVDVKYCAGELLDIL